MFLTNRNQNGLVVKFFNLTLGNSILLQLNILNQSLDTDGWAVEGVEELQKLTPKQMHILVSVQNQTGDIELNEDSHDYTTRNKNNMAVIQYN